MIRTKDNKDTLIEIPVTEENKNNIVEILKQIQEANKKVISIIVETNIKNKKDKNYTIKLEEGENHVRDKDTR